MYVVRFFRSGSLCVTFGLLAGGLLSACDSDSEQAGQPDTGALQQDAGGDGTSPAADGAGIEPDGGGQLQSCGNGQLDNGEECDGALLNDLTCQVLGYTGGTLKCAAAGCKLDTAGCTGTPTARQFGQTCSDTIGKCKEGLICAVPQGTEIGFCTAVCETSKPCPSLPKGADCIFKLSSNEQICGFVCDQTVCPPGLYCVKDDQGATCSTVAPVVCGDGKIAGGEDCDGADLGGKDCKALGYTGGALKCGGKCAFDTAGCTGTPTGNGFGALCGGGKGTCLPGLTCVLTAAGKDVGFCTRECSDAKVCPTTPPNAECLFSLKSGATVCGFTCDPVAKNCPAGLTCTPMDGGAACTNDDPAVCGNGKVELGEDCDGTALDNLSCKSFGYGGGTLKCSAKCTFDQSGCAGQTTCNPPPLNCASGTAACAKLELFEPEAGDGYLRGHYADWSYLRHDGIMVYKYAASQVACLLPGSLPVQTFDMSDKNGTIPKNDASYQPCLQESTTCQARHPAGTHTSGLDIDSSYFQTQGMAAPGPVCTHMLNGKEQYHCVESPLPPTGILDVTRTALMLAKVAESPRIRVIGADGKVGGPVLAAAQKLAQQGLVSTTALTNLTKRLAYEETDQGRGWFQFHHHHFHISFIADPYPAATPVLPWDAAAAADDEAMNGLDGLDAALPLAVPLPMAHPAVSGAALSVEDAHAPLVDLGRDPYAAKARPLLTVRVARRPLLLYRAK